MTNNCGESFPEGVAEAHVRWLANQMLNSYVIYESPLIPVGYPWTRLGYTYDRWPGSDRYGVSKYVIRKDSLVSVTEVIPYQTYCAPGT